MWMDDYLARANASVSLLEVEPGVIIVLEERQGRYLQLSGLAVDVMNVLRANPNGVKLGSLVRHLNGHTKETLVVSLERLANEGLITVRSGRTDCRKDRRPKWRSVLGYSCLNLWYRMMLRLRGWREVWQIRCGQADEAAPEDEVLVLDDDFIQQVVDEAVAVARYACILPWVSPLCTPTALALYCFLRHRGYRPRLVVGAQAIPFEPHIWVELEGRRADLSVDHHALKRFRRIVAS